MSIFDDYYRNNFWGNPESVSGNGSDLISTGDIRKFLPEIFATYSIKSITDIGCGDYNWWKEMDLPGIDYLGIDVVTDLAERNQRLYGDDTHRFKFGQVDAPSGCVNRCDLVFCRDVMVHMPNRFIQVSLDNIRRGQSKWLMATTFTDHSNEDPFDIEMGQWRPLNLQRLWGLPRPELLLYEGCKIPGYEDKALGMWKIGR